MISLIKHGSQWGLSEVVIIYPDIVARYSDKNLWSLQVQRFVVRYPLVYIDIRNWKITMLLMVKLTISMAMFHSYVSHYQRVCGWYRVDIWLIYGWYLVDIWLISGWYTVDIWLIYGWYMDAERYIITLSSSQNACSWMPLGQQGDGLTRGRQHVATKDRGQRWLVKLLLSGDVT